MAVRLRVQGGPGVPVSPKVKGGKRDPRPAWKGSGDLVASSTRLTEKIRGRRARPAASGAPGPKRVR